MPVSCKSIDPSYTIRSVAANASDQVLCMSLAQNAVHAAMAGYTKFTVGLVNNKVNYLFATIHVYIHTYNETS